MKTENGNVVTSDMETFPKIGLPSPICDLLVTTLTKLAGKEELDHRPLLADLEASMAIKQAFFNTLLLLISTVDLH